MNARDLDPYRPVRTTFAAKVSYYAVVALGTPAGTEIGKESGMPRKLARALAIAALVAAAPLLSACYTTQGAGEDLQAAGHHLSNSAADHTNYRP